ncbi:hypothetical protein [Legionella hackeliae]|uniref:Uncharacterized protein n=1 Tax=Legionella hackeliae TaxID=449 RepID=A0A0A8US51_LEGHA|nr:hypothetical protein [Legionella hackeliae]KTD10091.1 hypothetical protein Lhac_2459 [Legionella hackeliae]CEK09579.1 protein of unknown function [Legionella hackeliae]STX49489.1 Uncharacterised protein [Legionella hackeliae]
MAIRYLLDVDYTLMLTREGKAVFNQTLIDELKRFGVQEVDFLTKMDMVSADFGKALRVELIEHLEKNGIRVGKVLTTKDNMFLKSGYFPNLKLGETYSTLMRPVEEAIANVGKIKEYSKRYQQYRDHKNKEKQIKQLNFLIQNGALNWTDTLEEAGEKKEASFKLIDQTVLGQNVTKGTEIDFHSIQEIFITFRESSKNDSTIAKTTVKEYYDRLVKTYNDYQAPEDNTAEEQQLVDNYFLEVAHYGDTRYIASLRYESSGVKLAADENKGEIYAQYTMLDSYKEDDIVIYIDDDHHEHKSLNNAHKALTGFKHRLYTFAPPIYGDETQFNIPNVHITSEEFRRQHSAIYFNLLCNEGELALKEQNSRLAVQCFKAAYILVDDLGDTASISKKELLGKIMQAYKQDNDHMLFSGKEEVIDRCVSAFNRGTTETQLKILERDQAIHEARNPHLYRGHGLLNRFLTKEPTTVDSEFTKRILGLVNQIRANDKSPEALERCQKFLANLKDHLQSSLYRGAVDLVMNSLAGPQFEYR